MLNHETEIVVKPFPFLTEKLKELNTKYTDAVWDNNLVEAFKLQKEIKIISDAIKRGEVYDIPF